MPEPRLALRQRRFLRGEVQVELLDRETLLMRRRTGSTLQESKLDLRTLDPQPLRARNLAVAPLLCASILTLAAVGAAASGPFGAPDDEQLGFAVTALLIFGFPALYCWAKFVRESYDVVVFRGPYGDVVLHHGRPDAATFAAFTGALEKAIREAGPLPTVFDGGSAARELAALADLRDRGILDEAEFAAAKQRLLTGERADAPIGFARP